VHLHLIFPELLTAFFNKFINSSKPFWICNLECIFHFFCSSFRQEYGFLCLFFYFLKLITQLWQQFGCILQKRLEFTIIIRTYKFNLIQVITVNLIYLTFQVLPHSILFCIYLMNINFNRIINHFLSLRFIGRYT